MIKLGWAVFIEALQMALSIGPTVMRSALPQVIFFTLVMLVIDWSDVFDVSYLYVPIYMAVSLWLLGSLAVRVHRVAIMGPGALAQGIRKLENAYIWRWLLLGAPIYLVFLVFVAGLAFLRTYTYINAYEYGNIQLFENTPIEVTPYPMVIGLWFVLAALVVLLCSVTMFIFYRCAMGLPHLACDRGRITWRQSWNATRGISGTIAIASIVAAFCLLGTAMVLRLFTELSGLMFIAAPLYVIYDITLILVGACLMNVIYQRSDAENLI